MRSLAFMLLLAACATGPLAPDDMDHVSISSGGGFGTRFVDKIYANDTLSRSARDFNQETAVSWEALPAGTYAAVRSILDAGVLTVTEPDFSECPTDTVGSNIAFTQPVAGESSILSGCLPNGFGPIFREVNALLPSR